MVVAVIVVDKRDSTKEHLNNYSWGSVVDKGMMKTLLAVDSYSCSVVNCSVQRAPVVVVTRLETVTREKLVTRYPETVVAREKTRKLPGLDYWGKSTSRGLIELSLCCRRTSRCQCCANSRVVCSFVTTKTFFGVTFCCVADTCRYC